MDRPDPLETARDLVTTRFPDALGAWLGGSTAAGRTTETSDLDVVVVLAYADVHRESLEHAGWPVELFVHDPDSVRWFVDKDTARRRPTMARMVGRGLPIVEGAEARALAVECGQVLAEGPGPLPRDQLDAARYALTDLLDDLAGGGSEAEVAATAVALWQGTAELVLDVHQRWRGTAKWLARELDALDHDLGTSYADELAAPLRTALAGDPGPLVRGAEEVLAMAGGRLWAGYRSAALMPHR